MNVRSFGNLETSSRFAALLSTISDEDENRDSSDKSSRGNTNTTTSVGGEKSKKKKKKKKNNNKNDMISDNSANSAEVPLNDKSQDWKHWKDKDEQFVLDQFQKDLEAALEASRNDLLEQRNLMPAEKTNRKERRLGLQRNEKPMSMSLDEFVSGSFAVDRKCDDVNIPNGQSLSALDDFDISTNNGEHDEKPNQPVKTKSSKKKNKSKMEVTVNQGKDGSSLVEQKKVLEATEEDEKQAEFVKSVQIQDKLEKTIAELEELRTAFGTMKAELAQVKKRNKQLCHILGQGEMREKSELLLQIEDLNQVRDELTKQVSQLHAELEQERSKFHAARSELTKLQHGQSSVKSRNNSS